MSRKHKKTINIIEETCRFFRERRLQCESTLQPPLLFLKYGWGELAEGGRGYTRTRRSRPQRSAVYCGVLPQKAQPLCLMPFGRCTKRSQTLLTHPRYARASSSASKCSLSIALPPFAFLNCPWRKKAWAEQSDLEQRFLTRLRGFRHMSKYNENKAKVPRFHRNYRVIV